jgi:hypothetical protein
MDGANGSRECAADDERNCARSRHSLEKHEDQSAAECGEPDQRNHEGDIVMCHARQSGERRPNL